MEQKNLLKHVDHTLLNVTGTEAEYFALCDEGMKYEVASVCIPPSRVESCAKYVKGKLVICTVVGFPNGYADSSAKASEAKIAIAQGAAEIDMVVDIGKVKDGNFDAVLSDIKQVRTATEGYILKVIIEATLLTQEEKIKLCQIIGDSGADYIKTSTGFAGGGATFDDVALLRKHSPSHVKVKAAGGISSLEDAERFIALGADRLGTSRIVKIIKGMNADGY